MTDYRALLAELAVPRLAGTPPAGQVREALKRELAARGYVVMEQRFTARSLLHRLARVPLSGVNLIAVRPRTRVATWLVAHYDAKGQPLSMAARLAAAALAAVGVAELLGLALRALLGTAHPGMVDGVLVGSGSLLYAALELGCDGGVLAVACFAARVCAGILTAFRAGDRARAGSLQERLVPLDKEIVAKLGPAGVKAAMDLVGAGLYGGPVRAPLAPVTAADRERVAKLVAA